MRKLSIYITTIVAFFIAIASYAQAYQAGEYFKFQISYGFVNAGIATLSLSETTYDGKKVYHAKGYGYTTGITKTLFKVQDDYQSYFDIASGQPYRFIRKINEGGYTKNEEGFFQYAKNNVLVKDYKRNVEKNIALTNKNIQDIVSSFYYLRNQSKLNNMKTGETIQIDMFFDDEVYKFRLKLLGKEEIKTKFGKIKALKLRPYVQSGRVFKEEESLTIWVSDDSNKIPLKIQASLLVGSLKAELVEYKGLRNTTTFKK